MMEGDDPREALEGFQQVLAMEKDKGEWCVRRKRPGCVLQAARSANCTQRLFAAPVLPLPPTAP